MDNKGLILDGRYEVVRILGEGGMGKVYLCKNIRLDKLVAVKEFKKGDSVSLITEPHILKNLKHKGIPHIYDIFEENNFDYMVEEYIEGETLGDYINNNSLNLEQIITIASGLCDIIGYLHSFNPPIIYRDLKPSNIIIKSDGHPSLIDFGISRVYKENNLEDTIYMGSAGYAAPEQCGKGQSCKQTDVYGLGAVIYFMMNKKAPSNFLEALNFDAYNKSYGDTLPRIAIRAMALDVNKRFPTVEAMKQQLHKSQVFDRTMLMFQPETRVNHSVGAKNYSMAVEKKKNNIGRRKKLAILAGLLMVIFVMGAVAVGLNKISAEERNLAKEKTQGIEKVQIKDTEDSPVTPVNTSETDNTKFLQEEDDDETEENQTSSVKGKVKGKGNKKKK
jgi:serine/threonine protein kinase